MRTKLSRRRPHKNSSGKFPVPKPAKKFWLPPTGETPSTSQVQSTPRADIAKSDTDSASDITCPEDDESFLSKMQQKKAQEDDNSTEDNISIHSSDLNFSENSDDTPFTYFNKAYNKEYIHQRIKGASMEECDVVAEKKAFKVMDIWSCREDKKEKSTGAAEGTSFSHKEDHTLDEGMEIAAEAQGVQPTGAVDDVEEAQGVQPTAAVDDVKEAQGVQPTAAVNDEEVQLRAEPFSIHEDNEERPFGRILVQLGNCHGTFHDGGSGQVPPAPETACTSTHARDVDVFVRALLLQGSHEQERPGEAMETQIIQIPLRVVFDHGCCVEQRAYNNLQ